MNLAKGVMRPGKVLEVLENGVIKASAPGLFNKKDSTDLLPPINPFFVGNAHKFTSVLKNDEVWVLNFIDNPMELFYVRKDEADYEDEFDDIKKKNGLEVLMSRDNGTGKARIFFDNEDGWIIQNVDTIIQMNKKGEILLKTPMRHRCININSKNISIGTEGKSAQPAVLGDNLVSTLNILSNLLSSVSEAAGKHPYTIGIKIAIDAIIEKFDKSINKITSGHVTLD